MGNSERIKARMRLALRAERAFGLNSLRIEANNDSPLAMQVMMTESSSVAQENQPRREAVAFSLSPVPRNVDLFGAPVPGKPGGQIVPAAPSAAGAFSDDAMPTERKALELQQLDRKQVSICRKCGLCETRTNTVFGEGNVDATIFFIGEGPGENEDLQGRPFVGRAGELLGKMIAGMGLRREDVYIANIVKCRPPGNREPSPDEVAACTPYLERQLEVIRPRVIVTLGRPATHHMLQVKTPISRLRGMWQSWRGIKLMPTFHPAYILRNYTEQTRRQVWDDLQKVMDEVGLKKK